MTPPDVPARAPRIPRRLAAWAVHALTASGGVWGLCALEAAAAGRLRRAFGWLAAAFVVDALDGPLARRLQVRDTAPEIDGDLLDNLVDYLNYVVVPAFLLHRAGVLPDGFSLPAAACVCLVSALQFAHRDAKTADLFFRGFPAYWNFLAFYLLLLRLEPWSALAIVLAFCVLVFVPIRYVHPLRTPAWRRTTLALAAVWGVMLLALFARWPAPPGVLVGASLLFPAYYAALSLTLNRRRQAGHRPTRPKPPLGESR